MRDDVTTNAPSARARAMFDVACSKLFTSIGVEASNPRARRTANANAYTVLDVAAVAKYAPVALEYWPIFTPKKNIAGTPALAVLVGVCVHVGDAVIDAVNDMVGVFENELDKDAVGVTDGVREFEGVTEAVSSELDDDDAEGRAVDVRIDGAWLTVMLLVSRAVREFVAVTERILLRVFVTLLTTVGDARIEIEPVADTLPEGDFEEEELLLEDVLGDIT